MTIRSTLLAIATTAPLCVTGAHVSVAPQATAPVTVMLPERQRSTNTGRQIIAISPNGAQVLSWISR